MKRVKDLFSWASVLLLAVFALASCSSSDDDVKKAVDSFADYIKTQVLADDITLQPNEGQKVEFDDFKLNITVTKN